jgi:hypothetical protein
MRVEWIDVRTFRDGRGTLRVFEKGSSLPFPLKRCYVLSDVPRGEVRGGHKVSCDLFFAALAGTCRLNLRRGDELSSMPLLAGSKGVFVPKGTWLYVDRFSRGAVLLVCASKLFKDTRYSEKTDDRRKRKPARA